MTTTRKRRASNALGEPVAFITAIQAVLFVLATHGKLEFIGINSKNDVALVIAVLAALEALYVAFATDETVLAPLVAVVKAAVNLSVLYGFHLSEDDLGMIIAGITAVVGGWHRNSVSWLHQGKFTLAS